MGKSVITVADADGSATSAAWSLTAGTAIPPIAKEKAVAVAMAALRMLENSPRPDLPFPVIMVS